MNKPGHRFFASAIAFVTASSLAIVACSSSKTDDAGSCTALPDTVADAGCAPLYEPSYDNVFSRTLKPTCAKSGVSCHASTGRQGGLAFEDADEAYDLLVNKVGVVHAGNPACSELAARITSTDGTYRMPPGLSLPTAEQCAIVQWIANGAKR